MANRRSNVRRYRRPIHINLGVIIFLIILVYTIVICVSYFQKDHISIYEVTEKSIADDNHFKGIALRDETVYYTDRAGYINYYIGEGERIGKNDIIYSVDENGSIYNQIMESDEEGTVSADDRARIRNDISSFRKSYTDSNYSAVKDFCYDLENTVLETGSSTMVSNLKEIMKSTGDKSFFSLVSSKKSGIISYTMDGKETLKVSSITKADFENMKEERTQLRSSEAVKSGSPVYKMINSEDWQIVISLTDTQYDKLKEKEKVTVIFKKDEVKTVAGLTFLESGGEHFAVLSFNKYVIRYMNDRYLDIELLLNSAQGLKIPVTAILEKEFLMVPTEYVNIGGTKNTTGVIKETFNKKGDAEYTFTPVTVFNETEDGFYYIESETLSAGDTIQKADSGSEYELSKTGTLEGVYNVNKGYAVFRVIEKEYANKEYAIVKKGTAYGLSAYDHIVVDADTISESEIVNQKKKD